MRISGRTKIAELAASKIKLAELVTNSKYSSLKNQHHEIMKLRTCNCKVPAGVALAQLHFYHDIYINEILYTQLLQDRKHDVRQSLLIL